MTDCVSLPDSFLARMREQLGDEYEDYLASFREPSARSLRINTLKWTTREAGSLLPFLSEPVPWVPEGYYYSGTEKPALHPAYSAGLYYLQEASAMVPGDVIPLEPGSRVLDLCAAPGGKSTQLAARLGGTGTLYANDISASRAQALLKNLEMAGAGRIMVTAETPERLAERFPEYFDAVLADVPCSGEGMFRRDPSMVSSWNRHGPDYYQPVQRKIMESAAAMTAPGGFFLYSTCTFSRAEDEDNIEWFLDRYPDFSAVRIPGRPGFSRGLLPETVRLWPHRVRGDGHFAALLQRRGDRGSKGDVSGNKAERSRKLPEAGGLPVPGSFRDGRMFEWKDSLYLIPEGEEKVPGIRYLRTGLHLASRRNGRLIPSQALAMALTKEESASGVDFAWEDERVIRYLKGESVGADDAAVYGEDGYTLISVGGYPVGWAVRQNGRCKNKYNPGWRRQ